MIDEEVLAHWGIKGMKWGVRKDRKKKMSMREKRAEYKKLNKSPKREDYSKMTNDELQERIRRLELEKKYKDLTPMKKPPTTKEILDKYGDVVVVGTKLVKDAGGAKKLIPGISDKDAKMIDGAIDVADMLSPFFSTKGKGQAKKKDKENDKKEKDKKETDDKDDDYDPNWKMSPDYQDFLKDKARSKSDNPVQNESKKVTPQSIEDWIMSSPEFDVTIPAYVPYDKWKW